MLPWPKCLKTDVFWQFLLRMIDDFLLVTTALNQAEEFLRVMSTGEGQTCLVKCVGSRPFDICRLPRLRMSDRSGKISHELLRQRITDQCLLDGL